MSKSSPETAETFAEVRPSQGRLRRLSMRANFSWSFFSSTFNMLVLWWATVLIAKLTDSNVLGLYTLAQAVCLPVSWLTGLSLSAALITDARNEHAYGHYIGLRILSAIGSMIMLVVIAVICQYDAVTTVVILLLGLANAVQLVREMILGVMIKNECMDLSSRSYLYGSVLLLVGFTLGFGLTRSLAVGMVALVAARLGTLLFHDIGAAQRVINSFRHEVPTASLRPDYSWPFMKKLLIAALPLGVALTLSSLVNNVPVYYLEKYHGRDEMGYYGAVSALMKAGTVLLTTLGLVSSPRLARYFWENRPAFVRLLGKLMAVGAGMGLLGALFAWPFGEWALRTFFKPAYAAHSKSLIMMMFYMGLMLMTSFLAGSLVAARGFWLLLGSWAAMVGITMGIAQWLIPSGGVEGTIWTHILSSVASLVVVSVALWIRFRTTKPGGTQVGREGVIYPVST